MIIYQPEMVYYNNGFNNTSAVREFNKPTFEDAPKATFFFFFTYFPRKPMKPTSANGFLPVARATT